MPDEVRQYVLGEYGEIAGPIDPNLYDRITNGAEPITERPGDQLLPGIRKVRRDRGPFFRTTICCWPLLRHVHTTRLRLLVRSTRNIR